MHDRKTRYVKASAPESEPKPSPFHCSDCGETVYKHESGKFWCENCGELKNHAHIWDLTTKEGAKAEGDFRAEIKARREKAAREIRTKRREEAARELRDRARERREGKTGKGSEETPGKTA